MAKFGLFYISRPGNPAFDESAVPGNTKRTLSVLWPFIKKNANRLGKKIIYLILKDSKSKSRLRKLTSKYFDCLRIFKERYF